MSNFPESCLLSQLLMNNLIYMATHLNNLKYLN